MSLISEMTQDRNSVWHTAEVPSNKLAVKPKPYFNNALSN